MHTLRRFTVALALCAVAAGCSNSNSASTSVAVDSAPAVTTVPVADTTIQVPDTTEAPAPAASAWDTITAPADCMCSDGSGFKFFVHRADPTKLVFYLEGGGACFDASTCGPDSKAFKRTVGHENGLDDLATGIFDFANPQNPFKDWSIVFVPYCTGDVHIGNTTHDYGNGVVIQHKGYVNGTTALKAAHDLFPDAGEIVVTGESAGSVPTPLYAGLARDMYASASIKVLGDGSGAYPDIAGINAVIGANWGTMNAVPDWPENKGQTVETWSLPGLYIQAHKHAPDIVFSRHDYAFDKTQVFFAQLAGIPADDLVSLIDSNETQIEKSGMDLWSYISPGNSHTVLSKPDFYTETVNGTAFVQWVTDLVASKPLADVHCAKCTAG